MSSNSSNSHVAKGPKASGRRRRHYRVNKMPSGWKAACGGMAVYVAARGESKVNIMGGPTAMMADSAAIAVGPPITGRVCCVGGQRNIG